MSELTLELARRCCSLRLQEIPSDVVERARDALLDWFAVALAGSRERPAQILLEVLEGHAGDASALATIVGRTERARPLEAALVNGTAAHSLDFDDVNMRLICHVTAALAGGALALAEQLDVDGGALLCAYVAGYETVGRAGMALGPEPYLRGFHTTGTIGTLGAAAACAHLLELDDRRTAVALSLAATQAAGLKSNFGTMAKPLHAGRACQAGLLAAQLAQRGFTAGADALEGPQGLAMASGVALDTAGAPLEAPAGWHVRENLFKYHATCFLTHPVIDAIGELLAAGRISSDRVTQLTVHISELERGACTIAEPAAALEVKFSVAHLAAMALLGRPLSGIADSDARDTAVLAARAKVTLALDAEPGRPYVEVQLQDGSSVSATHDSDVPAQDLGEQRARLSEKFTALAEPVIGGPAAGELLRALAHLGPHARVRELLALARPSPSEARPGAAAQAKV